MPTHKQEGGMNMILSLFFIGLGFVLLCTGVQQIASHVLIIQNWL